MGEITRYRPDWSQDSTMRIIAYLAPDAQGDAVTYADHLADREQLQITLKGWLKENAPGGWIDDLRKENAALKAQLAIKEFDMMEGLGIVYEGRTEGTLKYTAVRNKRAEDAERQLVEARKGRRCRHGPECFGQKVYCGKSVCAGSGAE